MASVTTDFSARGKVIGVEPGWIVFQPSNTNYEWRLTAPAAGGWSGARNKPVELVIRAAARKVYTVPTGGNFVQPIFGPPRIVQGRVKHVDGNTIVVHAAVPFVVTLPQADSGIDLNAGAIQVGQMVNVTIVPEATFEQLEVVAQGQDSTLGTKPA